MGHFTNGDAISGKELKEKLIDYAKENNDIITLYFNGGSDIYSQDPTRIENAYKIDKDILFLDDKKIECFVDGYCFFGKDDWVFSKPYYHTNKTIEELINDAFEELEFNEKKLYELDFDTMCDGPLIYRSYVTETED